MPSRKTPVALPRRRRAVPIFRTAAEVEFASRFEDCMRKLDAAEKKALAKWARGECGALSFYMVCSLEMDLALIDETDCRPRGARP
jgi:hypothetical protein